MDGTCHLLCVKKSCRIFGLINPIVFRILITDKDLSFSFRYLNDLFFDHIREISKQQKIRKQIVKICLANFDLFLFDFTLHKDRLVQELAQSFE